MLYGEEVRVVVVDFDAFEGEAVAARAPLDGEWGRLFGETDHFVDGRVEVLQRCC
jgi:hypothetical protein